MSCLAVRFSRSQTNNSAFFCFVEFPLEPEVESVSSITKVSVLTRLVNRTSDSVMVDDCSGFETGIPAFIESERERNDLAVEVSEGCLMGCFFLAD